MATERLHAALSRLDERLARVTIGELGDLAEVLDEARDALRAVAPPAELTEARCPSCDHLTEGHTEDGCWHFVDLCPCALPHGKPTTTPEES